MTMCMSPIELKDTIRKDTNILKNVAQELAIMWYNLRGKCLHTA